MEFSSFAYCAESKNLNFTSFMSSRQKSDMEIHTNEMPFVELTGHKLQKPLGSSSFEINHFSRSFNLTDKIHNLASNAKQFMGSSFLTHKNIYGHNQFPQISFSQLVGGFVGSKSQIGSSSKETCQMWDIVFNKLAEFCDTHHRSQNCFYFDQEFSQNVLKSFCKKEEASCVEIESSSSIISGKTLSSSSQDTLVCNKERPVCVVIKNTESISHKTSAKPNNSSPYVSAYEEQKPSCVAVDNTDSVTAYKTSNGSEEIPDCSSQSSSYISKQSYAEMARIFARLQENKKSKPLTLTIPWGQNKSHRRNYVKCKNSHTTTNNWRNHCNPQIKEYRNQTRFFSGSQRRPYNNNNTESTKFSRNERNTDKQIQQACSSESQRVDDKTNVEGITSNSLQNSPKIASHQECHIVAITEDNKINQTAQTSPVRLRYMSECSTDSEDSFIVFESEMDCEPVIVAVISTSDSDISEDTRSDEFSDDDEEEEDDCDGDDTDSDTDALDSDDTDSDTDALDSDDTDSVDGDDAKVRMV